MEVVTRACLRIEQKHKAILAIDVDDEMGCSLGFQVVEIDL